MTQSPSKHDTTTTNGNNIPIEIVSEEEMAFFDAALATTSRSCVSSICSSSGSSLFQTNVRSIRAITALSKKRLIESDIEDLSDFKKKNDNIRVPDSFFIKFRKKSGLSVTDITSTEWCEKQMEFVLRYGRRRVSEAMKAGRDRHATLENEITKKVKLSTGSAEDVWALKFINFIIQANQLLFEGLTRELPLVGFLGGVWMVGVVDEIRMSEEEHGKPILVDTKTRVRDTLPAEPQRRNGRLQLMCYKQLWDNLVADKFATKEFFDFFSLNPHYVLSKEIRDHIAKAGIPAKTLDETLRYFKDTCKMLPPLHNEMILRYELQKDNSVLGEDRFAYDSEWLNTQIRSCVEFWLGQREARLIPEEEQWKCRFCQFASICPISSNKTSGPSSPVKSNSPDKSPR